MPSLRSFLSFVKRIIKRPEVERDLDDEIRSYVDELTDSSIRRGVKPEEAHRATVLETGGVELLKDQCRDNWSWRSLDLLAADFRLGFRKMAHSPGFAITIIATIGLGLGLNTAVFTVFDAYVLRPLPIPDPHSLYGFTWTTKSGNGHLFNAVEVESLRKDGAVFVDVIASQNLFTRVETNPMFGQIVSSNYFDVLRIGFEAGRPFTDVKNLAGQDHAVMVLGYDAWRNKFGADPAIIGRKFTLKGVSVEVVGVAKRSFIGLGTQPTEFWVPLSLYPLLSGGKTASSLSVTGRLPPNLGIEQARARLTIWSKLSTAELSEADRAQGTVLVSRSTIVPMNPAVIAAMAPVFLAFGLVLAGASVNIAGIMIARAMARSQEIGIRLSLGAGRGRLIQQLLAENMTLAMPAYAVGLLISTVALRFAQWVIVESLPPAYSRLFRLPDLSTHLDSACFLFVATIGSVLLFGLLPAMKITRTSLIQSSKGEIGLNLAPSRLRNGLVIGQIAICALLMVCSAIVFRSRLSVTGLDTQMDATGVYDVRVSNDTRRLAVDAMRREPGVQEVAAVWHAPWYGSLRMLAASPSGTLEVIPAAYNFVSPEYFQVLRIPLAAGRLFSSDEARSASPVAIVSEATARRFWPGRNPIGQTIAIGTSNKAGSGDKLPAHRVVSVVGVARDAINGIPANGVDQTCIYFPTSPEADGALSLLVKVNGGKADAVRTIERSLDFVVRGAADQINPMEEVYALSVYPFHMILWLSLFLCGISLLLMVTGVYAITSSWVNQRRKELGIRMAVGATPSSVVRLVLSGGIRLTLYGIVIGISTVAALSPLFANQIRTVDPYDVAAYSIAAIGALAAAVASSLIPAYKAARTDPLSSLRSD